MNLSHRIQRSFKPRFAVIYPFGLFVLFFCYLNIVFLKAGLTLIVIGVFIRLWANGYAIKNDKLTTSGPYAFVRNPLYLGTFLIAIGFVVLLTSHPPILAWSIGGLFLIALSLVYIRTIADETGMLSAKFKDDYKAYCQRVPAILPCPVPYTKGEQWPFSLDRLLLSKEHKTVFWVFILIVVFHLKTLFFIEHKPMNEASWTLCGIALTLLLLDTAYECNKKKWQHKK